MPMQFGTAHYKGSNIEPLDVIEDWNLGFNLGNVVKYIGRTARPGKKHQARIEDMVDAVFYLILSTMQLCEHVDEAIHVQDHIASALLGAAARATQNLKARGMLKAVRTGRMSAETPNIANLPKQALKDLSPAPQNLRPRKSPVLILPESKLPDLNHPRQV